MQIFSISLCASEEQEVDVCVYGATPSGIVAAIAVAREGKSVIIVEPSRWVGGMSGAGIKPSQDCPNINMVGGLSHKLILSLGLRGDLKGLSFREIKNKKNQVRINPLHVREDYLKLLEDNKVKVIYDHRIASVIKENLEIKTAIFDFAPFDSTATPPEIASKKGDLSVKAKVFIDCSYEGDFLPRSGVNYRTGREGKNEFNEQYAGVQEPLNAVQLDPFVTRGDPASGLLKWVEDEGDKALGDGDRYTQAYNYRYYTTNDPQFRIPFTRPADYDAQDYELIGRYVQTLVEKYKNPSQRKQLSSKLTFIFPGNLNSGEHNYMRWGGQLFSQAPLGVSWKYADGDYAEKSKIWKMHQTYLSGMHEFFSTDSRVPEWHRKEIRELGRDKRQHPDTLGWPNQLYIRIARRMEGKYVHTEQDVYGKKTVGDPVGLAQYGIDTYPCRRIWFEKEGEYHVALEGIMFIGHARGPTDKPYAISYRSIVPKASQCSNLIVPVCFSSSYIGYASARMENVFMVLGESAGIAANLAIENECKVQEVAYDELEKKLLKYGQIIDVNVGKSRK